MVIESSYGVVLWAVPRFRRSVATVPAVLQPRAAESENEADVPVVLAPVEAEDGQAGRCTRTPH
jgi:hypothetical protein